MMESHINRAYKLLRLVHSDGRLYRVLRFTYADGWLYWAI